MLVAFLSWSVSCLLSTLALIVLLSVVAQMASGLVGAGSGGVRLGYITDVEGNLEYFRSYVARSTVLRYDASGSLQLLDEHAYFVFGGDVVDLGDGDIRLCRELVSLKQQRAASSEC